MGMMHVMRERMVVIMWVLLIIFVGSMTVGGLVGGANIIDELFGKTDISKAIAVVNGEIISPDDFFQTVNYRLEDYRERGQNVDARTLDQVRTSVWNELVDQLLYEQEIEERDISVTNEEIYYHLKNDPPSFIQQIPNFQTDDAFDYNKYMAALLNPQGDEWAPVENYMQTLIPRGKLENQIRLMATVSPEKVSREYVKQNVEHTLSALVIKGSSFKDDVEPTDDEILLYYDTHLDEYDQPERRRLKMVKWEKNPSKEDTLRVLEDADNILSRIHKGEDFAALANDYSEDPGNFRNDEKNGGDLGWFGRGQMVGEFENAVFSTDSGDIVGPVLTNFGYHIIWVRDKRIQENKEEVLASHILLKIEMGPGTREELRQQASLFSWDVEDYGFDEALEKNNLAPDLLRPVTEDTKVIPAVGFYPAPVRFAFNSDIGAYSDVMESDRAFMVFSLDSILAPGPKPLEDVKYLIQRNLTIETQTDLARKRSDEIYNKAVNGQPFEEIAEQDDKVIYVPSTTQILARPIPQIGKVPVVIGAFLSSEPGELFPPLELSQGFAIIKFEGRADFDSTDWEVNKDIIYKNLLTQTQNQVLQDWQNELREKADIVDNRKYYF